MQKNFLNLSSQQVVFAVQNNIQKYEQGHTEVNNENEELRLLSEQSCPDVIPANLDEKTLELLGKLIRGEFYNFSVMKLASCVLFAIYSGKLSSVKVSKWLNDLKELSQGANGITLLGTLGNFIRNDIIIKYPKRENLTHEVFVGLAGTNYLRHFIPNYAFVYGGFSCSPPIINEKKVYDFCVRPCRGCPINYALYENISPAISMQQAIRNGLSGKEFLDLYLQVILALQVGYEKINFTHFDLHTKNVLLREISKINVPYDLEKGYLTLKTDLVATIIDFGFSSIFYQGKRFVSLGGLFKFIGNVKTFPLYDAFKLLSTAYEDSVKFGNGSVVNIIERIFLYFTRENPLSFVASLEGYYFSLPSSLSKISLYNLIDYLIFLSPQGLDLPGKLLACDGLRCPTKKELISEINLSSIKYPADVATLYIDLKTLPSRDLRKFVSQISEKTILDFIFVFVSEISVLDSLIDNPQSESDVLKAVHLYRKLKDDRRFFMYISFYLPVNIKKIKAAFSEINLDLLKARAKALRENLIKTSSINDSLVRAKINYLAE